MNMKRIIALLLAVLLLMPVLGGCEMRILDESQLPPGALDDEEEDLIEALLFDENDIYHFGREVRERYDENAITIAFCGIDPDLLSIIRQYMEEVENVNIVEFPIENGIEQLNTKLMAQDTDIDLFYDVTFYMYTYIKMSYYTDLSQFGALKERIESNNFARCAASCNGGYIGIPLNSCYFDYATVDCNWTIDKYLAKNLSALNGEFKDPDGEELYKVLRHFYDHPDDPREGAPYNEDFKMIDASFLIMNPSSEKKEKAAEFMAYLFDFINGGFELSGKYGKTTPCTPYPELEDTSDIHLAWDYQPWSIMEPVRLAWNDVRDGKTDGSEKALRKLAQDAARGVLMRLEG